MVQPVAREPGGRLLLRGRAPSQNFGRGAAIQLAKFAGTATKLLFERLTKSRVRIISGGQSNFRYIHSPHAQLAPGSFQADSPHITGDILTSMSRKNAMKVGHRETGYFGQNFSVKGFVNVVADVLINVVEALAVGISHHAGIISYQNGCSLLQMYHEEGEGDGG